MVLDAARAKGEQVVVAAIKEETQPEIIERAALDSGIRVHWLSLGELSKLIETFRREGVSRAIMAGQVKHKQIFSSIRPDWRLAKLLLSIRTRNTDALLGAISKVLGDEGITLLSSTFYLEPLLARAGVLTKRAPNEDEQKNVSYGRAVALHLAQYDIGQTVVIAESACIAVEAMEGTDATILRAGEIIRSLHHEHSPDSFLSRALTVVKVAKPKQDCELRRLARVLLIAYRLLPLFKTNDRAQSAILPPGACIIASLIRRASCRLSSPSASAQSRAQRLDR